VLHVVQPEIGCVKLTDQCPVDGLHAAGTLLCVRVTLVPSMAGLVQLLVAQTVALAIGDVVASAHEQHCRWSL
jgi:hypothetical protein